MPLTLQEEIKQSKPFSDLREEADLNIIRTANLLTDDFEKMLKPYGITGTQYNVLRILRGAGPAGLCRNEVSARMLTRMPDATRLLDRMEEAGLVVRARSENDRRLVATQITAKGRRLVDSLDGVATRQHSRALGHLSDQQLKTLVKLLTLARAR
ncbi:MAG: MarR family transcriptional regulator [Gemmatimonadaceae bacterium]